MGWSVAACVPVRARGGGGGGVRGGVCVSLCAHTCICVYVCVCQSVFVCVTMTWSRISVSVPAVQLRMLNAGVSDDDDPGLDASGQASRQ